MSPRHEGTAEELQREIEKFTPSVIPDIWVCPYDGNLVGDREQHIRWHYSLGETIREARHASSLLRPIG